MSIAVSTLGFPRIGPGRELKTALEKHWSGRTSARQLLDLAMAVRAANWGLQHASGITQRPSNDFSLYDQTCSQITLALRRGAGSGKGENPDHPN